MSTSVQNHFQFPEVRVVEASAGSGKTYALAKRYIQLLLNPQLEFEQIPIRNILAITFTNKAAFEMKARILQFLKSIALGTLPEPEFEALIAPLGITPEQARSKAFLIMEDLIHHYNFFQVQTIDKFINALLSGCAFKVGLTANFKIKTNAFEYLEYSLDRLIDQLQSNPDHQKMFRHFLHNYLYLENRTGWFPKDDMLSIIYTLFQEHNTYGMHFRQSDFHSKDVIQKKRMIIEEIQSLYECLPEGIHLAFKKNLDKFLKKHQNSFDIDSISTYFMREYIPVKKNTVVTEDIDQLWNLIRLNLKHLCEEEAYSLFNPYIEIFYAVMGGFYELSTKDDILFLEELNKKAGLLFDEDYVTVEELYYRLATRFHHYLLDEFQDTSRLQWHNVNKMVEEALSTGGSMFYVGDRKQAIYGFRGGDVRLFDEIKNSFEAFNVQIEPLTNNWRSERAIVDLNNAVFSMTNLKNFINKKEYYELEKKKKSPVHFSAEDLKALENVFQGSQQTFQPQNVSGYVKIEAVEGKRKEDRDELIRERVINLIKELRTRFQYKEIAILTRGNAEIEQVTNWLLEEGMLVESERTSNVKENPLIQNLLSFLRFLRAPIDNLSFAEFIVSEFFAGSTGLSVDDMHNFVFAQREKMRKTKDFNLYKEFQTAYPEIWNKYIEEFFKNVGLYPLYELVVSIYHRYRCLDQFSAFQGYFMHFLEIIKKNEEDYPDMSSFLEYLDNLLGEELYVNIADSDAIKILTIHKSKGLEFPVVIIPFLGMDVQVGSTGIDNQKSYILKEDNGYLELMRIKAKYLSFSETLYSVFREEYLKAFLSELNSVYVALTRPQRELYAFYGKRVGNSVNLVQFLIPEDFHEVGTKKEYPSKKEQSQEFIKLPVSKYHDWIQYLKDEYLAVDDIANREERIKGEVLHTFLSFLGRLDEDNFEKDLQIAATQTQDIYPEREDIDEHLSVVKKMIMMKNFKPFFFGKETEVFTEKEIVNAYGHSKRLDRLILEKDKVTVIDYKSRRLSGSDYHEQVREYQNLLKEIFPDKTVKGFLLYIEEMECEEVK